MNKACTQRAGRACMTEGEPGTEWAEVCVPTCVYSWDLYVGTGGQVVVYRRTGACNFISIPADSVDPTDSVQRE